ncbi:Cation channel sperm-associated protein subunit beta, partial [Sciurus carolinensis]|nr:Cation channel sperm-associated protein subunit beta [Sciurus carolinensis]
DIAAVEEWLVRITLHKGLNIYATEGTLLDSVREPILQWILGRVMIQNEINTLFPHVTDVKVTKCPCANDVALIGFILNTTYNGVFVGLTSSGFWDYGSTVWYDLTDNIYVSLHEEHSGLSLIDMVLTNHILVVLTSLGLFVSEDLRYPSGQILKLTRADFCGFERVWLSVDGGNTFELLADFHNDIAKNSYHSYYTSDITFACQSGKVYLTKAGLGVYSEIGSIDNKIFALYYDHLGFIHKLTPDHFEDGGVFAGFGNSRSIFGLPPDMGFDTALAPQFLTINDVIFFAYVPLNEPQETIYTKKFSNIHYGKVIHSGKTGKAYIKQIMQHKIPKGFMSSVIAETINPFGLEDEKESSCLSSSLSIEKTTSFAFKLTLDLQTADSSFKTSDIEKTVVIPGYSSFLITEILDDKNALALATMPENIPFNMVFIKDTWFLYNFGSVNGRKWAIFLKPCNYWVQQPDDSLSLNIVKYIDLGNSQVFKIKVIPNSKYFQIIDYPLVEIIVGNPMLLEVNVKGFFDDTHSYLVEISVASRSLRQETGKYKQCAHVSTREECNCTWDQKFSHAVAFSDCKEKGSELFHFRVTVVPGVTFCNLVEEFQIYVDEVPLPFPGHTLIAVAAAVVLGGLIFTAFMFQLRNIHPWRAFRRWIRRNTLNLSNTNVP